MNAVSMMKLDLESPRTTGLGFCNLSGVWMFDVFIKLQIVNVNKQSCPLKKTTHYYLSKSALFTKYVFR